MGGEGKSVVRPAPTSNNPGARDAASVEAVTSKSILRGIESSAFCSHFRRGEKRVGARAKVRA
jgi:hypothetical protein